MTKIQKERFDYDSPDGLPFREVWDSEKEDTDDYEEEQEEEN